MTAQVTGRAEFVNLFHGAFTVLLCLHLLGNLQMLAFVRAEFSITDFNVGVSDPESGSHRRGKYPSE